MLDRADVQEILLFAGHSCDPGTAYDSCLYCGKATPWETEHAPGCLIPRLLAALAAPAIPTEASGHQVAAAVWRACESIEGKAQESENGTQASAYREATGIIWDEMAAIP